MDLKLPCRINSWYCENDRYYTLVTEAAPSLYEDPSTYRLISDGQIGKQGDVILADVSMTGYIRETTYLDRETGQKKDYLKSNVFLQVKSFKHESNQNNPRS
jgi:hypothetical protein